MVFLRLVSGMPPCFYKAPVSSCVAVYVFHHKFKTIDLVHCVMISTCFQGTAWLPSGGQHNSFIKANNHSLSFKVFKGRRIYSMPALDVILVDACDAL